MQYLYHPDASADRLEICGDEYRYLFKVRRHKKDHPIYLRNLSDDILYQYKVVSLDRRSAQIELVSQQELIIAPSKELHIGWCIIEPKKIEKTLPMLNEVGVSKITFIYCQRSQKQFKVDIQKLQKILINSSQQSGRSVMMELNEAASLEEFIQAHPHSHMLNFSDNTLTNDTNVDTITIGCEGGFTQDEIALFDQDKIIGLKTPMILRSESAAVSVASLVLL